MANLNTPSYPTPTSPDRTPRSPAPSHPDSILRPTPNVAATHSLATPAGSPSDSADPTLLRLIPEPPAMQRDVSSTPSQPPDPIIPPLSATRPLPSQLSTQSDSSLLRLSPLPLPTLDQGRSDPMRTHSPLASTSVALHPITAPRDRAAPSPSASPPREPPPSRPAPPLLPFLRTPHSLSSNASAHASVSSDSGSRPSTPSRDTDDDDAAHPLRQHLPSRVSSSSKGKRSKPHLDSHLQLVPHLPNADVEARRTFTELSDCTYASKALGNLQYFDEDESRCECIFDHDFDGDATEQACGEGSQCMNRLMQIECVSGDCRCGTHCQNQRFQKYQYAAIEVVKTEKKGFGVRAKENMAADTFIYEYVGEVIGQQLFTRKMKEYAAAGIRHFYFMALDKDVFIDATKKGGLGRFLNHSCNPNCVVAKWTIGKKMRMGIFAKRAIQQDEELTFNYNVDRYGHVAQDCFCGEPNCMGVIGGTTQTDIGGMDDLYLDALGIAEEVEALGLRGSKKKKGKQLDDEFLSLLKPIQIDEVPKVSAAMRQAITTRHVLQKLLLRVHMTTSVEIQRNLMRLHGLNVMNHILKEYIADAEVIALNLDILARWPLLARNKIETSKIEDSVQACSTLPDAAIRTVATNLLAAWSTLELVYRIPRSHKEAGEASDRKRHAEMNIEHIAKRARTEVSVAPDEPSRPAFVKPEASVLASTSPLAREQRKDTTLSDADRSLRVTSAALDINDVIAQAQREAEMLAVKEQEAREREEAERKVESLAQATQRSEAKARAAAAMKEKKLMSLFGTIVVGVMSKYKSHLDPDQFKKRAKEVTQLLCDKEKRHPLYATETYDKLSADKTAKVKAFAKDWVKKLLERRSGRPQVLIASSSSSAPSQPVTSLAASPPLKVTPGDSPAVATPPTPETPNPVGSALESVAKHFIATEEDRSMGIDDD